MKLKIKNCKIKHIETMVPSKIINNIDLEFEEKLKKKVIKNTGVVQRYVLEETQSFLEMYTQIGLNTIKSLDWDKNSIDGIIVVSQTPEYKLPATSCILQGTLGLNSEAFSYDISMGCSGYIYGLFNTMSNISATNGDIKRVLLFVGDAISTIVNPKNKSNAFLFGDAVSCTAIEYDINSTETPFILKTDGKEFDNIIIKDSGLKNKITCNSFEEFEDEDGNINSKNCLYMNGAKVFNFTVDNVPNIIEETLAYTKIDKENIEGYYFHQANKFMIEFLSSKIGVDKKTPINIEKFGNTSCTSIPLLLTQFEPKSKNNMLIGFGVGMSMGTCIVDLKDTTFNHSILKETTI
ncbi:ketoacyl-ACP synthase III [Aliarcobacter butzleri]|uniref:ketoacyl-ACP synthase III n=1 Tax=Aliarcobacter butzleri TaxID=28197 RepID=UPI0021B3D8FE|nr:ketoacyl-ACP synthase III [Aliarcobacter butzleri]MCT7580019.1 ketoacyl-ACP synthase III [Aliarcobacter butzleri]MCT7584793.1 ketoacyl-ACP synthase III [Aliarcobacter butzleri]